MMSVDAAVGASLNSGFDRSTRATRVRVLGALADALEAHGTELIEIAARETHLTVARLTGEITRTAFQLRFFADVVAEGSYLEATLDTPDATLIPPRPDLRRMLQPLGPVAVFTASNFPFAFSVLGNDTASALAAGCPVIVKAHHGHPELSRRTAEIARAALDTLDVSVDALTLVEGHEAGIELVRHHGVRAAGFTGSESGGRALFDIANARPAPIPFYGELGSLNPVVVTPAASAARAESIAVGLVASFTRDAGQYCTKPGVVLVPAAGAFTEALRTPLSVATAGRQLTDGMTAGFAKGSAELTAHPAVEVLLGAESDTQPIVVSVPADAVLADPQLFLQERFGPLTLVIGYRDEAQLLAVLQQFEGSLTGTIHCEPEDDVTALTRMLERVAGRVVFNGWPTGVSIAWAQHHGGPWPSTTASIHSSVGATAIRRWLAPITYQDAPAAVLPIELRDAAPGVPRRIDGVLNVG